MSRYKLVTLANIDIPSAGTRVRVSSTEVLTPSIIITAAHGNSGNIYVGDANVSSTQYAVVLAAKSSYVLEAPKTRNHVEDLSLSDIYVDAATSGDDVRVAYLVRS